MKSSIRTAYSQLYKFFGLRGKDGYLSAITEKSMESKITTQKVTEDDMLGEVFHSLYGDENVSSDIFEICKKISMLDLEKSKKVICVTPYTLAEDLEKVFQLKGNEKVGSGINTFPFNSFDITMLSDQGLVGNEGNQKKSCKEDPRVFTVDQMSPKFQNGNRIDVIQIFPCRGINELTDTDVLTLYMSTINSVNMSQAVPYVDVLVSVQGKEDDLISESAFSFGNFLNMPNDITSNAKFEDQSASGSGARDVKNNKGEVFKRKIQSVASMEIFTSPQTLVNATPDRVRYNENTDAGRHVDVFRPFLTIEGLSLSVVPANAGLISYKTANMKLKLFDRGNFSKIAPIVAPSRFGLVKFDIEYGWSHPAGKTITRPADAKDDRIGELIDAMRVTESYQVINSNFTFEQDGSVSIDLKLSMLGTAGLSDRSVSFTENDEDIQQIEFLLKEIQGLMANYPKEINKPAVLTGGVDTFFSMNAEDKKQLRQFIHDLTSGSRTSGVTSIISKKVSKLIGKSDKDPNSVIANFQESRLNQVKKFITNLQSSDDPFMRTEGLCNQGLNAGELLGPNNTKYASLGSIIVSAIGPSLQSVGDVIFVFTCFNKNAGAMYDHNIAQFPIKLVPKNPKEVVLQTVLNKAITKSSKITPEAFLELINENFILRESSEAYGLSDIYRDQPVFDENDAIKESYVQGVQNDSEKPGSQLQFEDKKIDNLEKIYGKGTRNSPNFTIPRISMKIDVKPSASGRNIVKVTFFDQAASNVGDIQEIFNDVTSNGFFIKDEISVSKDGVRGAQHGEIAEKVFQELIKPGNELLEQYKPEGEADTLLKKLEEMAKDQNPVKFEEDGGSARKILEAKLSRVFFLKEFKTADTKLRNVFYKFFPTLIYGSMGSGIISAQLSSNQNDALTTISLQTTPGEPDAPAGLPMLVHPTQLSIEVFGTPMFKYSQKFFIDFGTGTSADNFYVVGGVDMNFGPGEFKTNLKMTQLDVFGRFMKLRETIYKTLISSYFHEKRKIVKKKRPVYDHKAAQAALGAKIAEFEGQDNPGAQQSGGEGMSMVDGTVVN